MCLREGSGIAGDPSSTRKTSSELYKTAPRDKADYCSTLCLFQVSREDIVSCMVDRERWRKEPHFWETLSLVTLSNELL